MQAQGYRRRRFQELLLFCMVPWILTPACKAKFFKVEAMMQMQRQVHASSINVRISTLPITPRSKHVLHQASDLPNRTHLLATDFSVTG